MGCRGFLPFLSLILPRIVFLASGDVLQCGNQEKGTRIAAVKCRLSAFLGFPGRAVRMANAFPTVIV